MDQINHFVQCMISVLLKEVLLMCMLGFFNCSEGHLIEKGLLLILQLLFCRNKSNRHAVVKKNL